MHRQAVIQQKIDELVEELDEETEIIPAGLGQRVAEAIKLNPARSWDAIMREIAEQGQDEAP
jgi:hypothetical protein